MFKFFSTTSDEDKPVLLILSHGFNMDGRAASQAITDKIPHLLDLGIEPVVISAITVKRQVDRASSGASGRSGGFALRFSSLPEAAHFLTFR